MKEKRDQLTHYEHTNPTSDGIGASGSLYIRNRITRKDLSRWCLFQEVLPYFSNTLLNLKLHPLKHYFVKEPRSWTDCLQSWPLTTENIWFIVKHKIHKEEPGLLNSLNPPSNQRETFPSKISSAGILCLQEVGKRRDVSVGKHGPGTTFWDVLLPLKSKWSEFGFKNGIVPFLFLKFTKWIQYSG